MAEPDDHQLLAQFARENSEAAFATLVERHVGLVYSIALRSASNAHAAEEITQAVFIILARKADGLSLKIILSGWLYQTTRLTAANFLRTEIRRQHREQEAYMQSLLNEPNATETWTRIAPLLDDALDKLGARDRDAIALRFFENKSFAEVGQATGASEDAAKVRVNRALEKLRKIFTKRGVTLSALAITGAVSANSVQAAPVGLAKTISVVAFTKGAAAGGSTLALVKGALKIMAWTKAKIAIVVGVCVLLAAGTASVAVYEMAKPKYNPNDFSATTYPTGAPEMMQYITNNYGQPLKWSFDESKPVPCSINGLLNQCMEISGWQYLMDKNVSAGTVRFGCKTKMNGEQWVTAFEEALQTGTPEWWDTNRKMRQENLVLVRFPKEKTVLVLPKDKASKYQ